MSYGDNVASMAWKLNAIEAEWRDGVHARCRPVNRGVDLAMAIQAEEEQARVPLTYSRRMSRQSRRSMSSVNSGVTEEPSLIHEQPKLTLADKRRMLLEVPQALEQEIDEVEAHMQAIMNDTLKMDRRARRREP